MKRISVRLIAVLGLCFSIGQSAPVFGIIADPPLFFTPNNSANPDVLAAINGAKTSIHMTMYHLTDQTIIEALIAASKRGVDVQVILDVQQAVREKPTGAYHQLKNANVMAVKSSGGFSLSHVKAFVIDGKAAYIMTLNLTRIASTTRDVGYVANDPTTVAFVEELFTMDLKNAANQDTESPDTIPDNIVLSPTHSRPRLEALIASAKKTLQITVENLSDNTIIADIIAAKARGVDVQVLLPRCDLSSANFDMPAARQLNTAQVDVRLMPAPASETTPYIHQKSIVVDDTTAFLGSENFSFNSLDHARELGLIFSDVAKIRQMTTMFNADFSHALNMRDAEAFTCPMMTFSVDQPPLAF